MALAAVPSGYVAATYALRPRPFVLGLGIALAGLLTSLLLVPETRRLAQREATGPPPSAGRPSFREAFARVSWRRRPLVAPGQAGFVNNLNDGVARGLLPLYFAASGHGVAETGLLVALPRRPKSEPARDGHTPGPHRPQRLAVTGTHLQAAALALPTPTASFEKPTAVTPLPGADQGGICPILPAAFAITLAPTGRASAVGVYRLRRGRGYVAGALIAGSLADALGTARALGAVATLTAAPGLFAARAMRETHPLLPAPPRCSTASSRSSASSAATTAPRSEATSRPASPSA